VDIMPEDGRHMTVDWENREAGPDEAWDLLQVEKAAAVVGLRHIFPPESYPYPEGHVLARWAIVLDSPDVTTLVWPSPLGLVAFVAYDDTTVRHLGVHPAAWGRGLGRTAVLAAVDGIRARGAAEARLWCLVENGRARRLYEHLGWTPTAEEREAEFPPHPVEMEYRLPLG
jgi:GNAT superfamily N-acetyltransferase